MSGKLFQRERICPIVVLLSLGLCAPAAAVDEPFGISTERVDEGPLAVVWRNLRRDIEREKPIIDRCRAEPRSCDSPAAMRLLAIVAEGDHHQGLARIGRINRASNLALQRVRAGAAQAEHSAWVSPLTALAAETGDCRQFATIKYVALTEAGYAPEDLRIVIVLIRSTRTTHAVLAVRHDRRWMILDNRSLAVVDSAELPDLQPLFELDHRGVRRFVRPDRPVADVPCRGVGEHAEAVPGPSPYAPRHHGQGLASLISIEVISPLSTKSP